jgi:mannose-6-phosphate isomerase-like protein (cupin superfamily)
MKQESQTITLAEKDVSEANAASQFIIPREKIFNGTNHLFQGKEHGNVPISFFWVESLPGRGPKLHKHPYEEIFVVQEGLATFTLGRATVSVSGGHIVIAPRNTPHKFVNSGQGILRLVAIHCNRETIGVYLEN